MYLRGTRELIRDCTLFLHSEGCIKEGTYTAEGFRMTWWKNGFLLGEFSTRYQGDCCQCNNYAGWLLCMTKWVDSQQKSPPTDKNR